MVAADDLVGCFEAPKVSFERKTKLQCPSRPIAAAWPVDGERAVLTEDVVESRQGLRVGIEVLDDIKVERESGAKLAVCFRQNLRDKFLISASHQGLLELKSRCSLALAAPDRMHDIYGNSSMKQPEGSFRPTFSPRRKALHVAGSGCLWAGTGQGVQSNRCAGRQIIYVLNSRYQ